MVRDVIIAVFVIIGSVAAQQTEETTTPFVFPDVLKTPELSWLEKYVRPDGTITFLKGSYILALNKTLPNPPAECTTGQGIQGKCTLLDGCKKLYTELKGELEFKDYFCSIDETYVGVCCTED